MQPVFFFFFLRSTVFGLNIRYVFTCIPNDAESVKINIFYL